jgi:hypothetical protein
MAELSHSEKSVKLPSFSGEPKDFQILWVLSWAYSTVYKTVQALGRTVEPEMPATEATVVDESTDAGKARVKALRRNAVAMAKFTMAFTTEATMGIVFMAQSTEWPTGLAYLVVVCLFKKYRPEDSISRVEVRQQLNKVSMKKGENPAVIFEQISSIKNKFRSASVTIDNNDLIAVVLDAANTEYQSVLTAEQRNGGTVLSLEDLESAMTQHWHQISGTSL